MCWHVSSLGKVPTRADTSSCRHVPTPVIPIIWTSLGCWNVVTFVSTWKGADTWEGADTCWHEPTRLGAGMCQHLPRCRYLSRCRNVSTHPSIQIKSVWLVSQVSSRIAWWRHQMETFSALLAFCAGNSPVPGEFPAQRPVTRSFDAFFDLRLNKRLNKHLWGWWSETLSRSLWCHSNGHLDVPAWAGTPGMG